jgi:hypothetical protein
MFLEFKNKGALIPIYIAVSLIGVISVISLLKNYVGGPFDLTFETTVIVGISFIITGIWSLCTYDSFYVNEATGEKKQMYEENTFFYIHMKLWGYVFIALGAMLVVGGILTMMKIID